MSTRKWMALSVSFWLYTGQSAMGEDAYVMTLPATSFYGATSFSMAATDDPSDTREVLLAAYKSPLGSVLKKRDPTSDELGEIRAACRYFVALARSSSAGEFDDYFIELADGVGLLEEIEPSRRTVFGFERETGCDGPFTTINVR